jgi:hypothetical protein
MADQDRPNQNANKSKAEGERWSSEQQSPRNSDHDENPEAQYRDDADDDAAGITNRPLSDEVENQQRLPDRGTYRDEPSNPSSRRREGDYEGSER